jgi:hypothetical protein
MPASPRTVDAGLGRTSKRTIDAGQLLRTNHLTQRLWCAGEVGAYSLHQRGYEDDLFKGRHFDQEIIVVCVRWYLRFKLSSRDLVEMMAERRVALAHTTIMLGFRAMFPSSKSDGIALPAKSADPGGSTKLTSRSKVAGPISIALSTARERRSISCCGRTGMSSRRRPFSGGRSKPRADCPVRSRSMATKRRTGLSGRSSANIRAARGQFCDPRNI